MGFQGVFFASLLFKWCPPICWREFPFHKLVAICVRIKDMLCSICRRNHRQFNEQKKMGFTKGHGHEDE